MDGNKKESRNEHSLVRMSKQTRENMSFGDSVELYPITEDVSTRLGRSTMLDIYQAFQEDLKAARENGLSPEELKRVGFVTTNTYNKITGTKTTTKENIWITDSASDTVIGADPEFMLFDSEGKVIRANNVMPFSGMIGCDGAMAEIRPKPAITPEGLIENIRSLLVDEKLITPIKSYKWMAGCYFADDNRDYPVGGHIHVGNPIRIAKISEQQRFRFFWSFNKILDELLAIPMIKLDGTKNGKARRVECKVGKYGFFGGVRMSNGHLEHRTLSGMWLMHPHVATAVAGTTKAIVDEVYKLVSENKYNMEYMFPNQFHSTNVWSSEFSKWPEIPLVNDMGCRLSSAEMISFLHDSKAERISNRFLEAWYERMKGLSTYKTYSKYVDNLYDILKIKTKAFTDHDRDIKKAWVDGADFLK